MNALNVSVAGEPGSDASKALRKGIATIMAVHRDLSIDSYYGESAWVIEYPITTTSWAAPLPSDPGYEVAFSKDVEGNAIYTPEMTLEEKVAVAEETALGWFEAAGFTVEDGMLTAAPDGAKLSYEVLIPADGTGDHPAFQILTNAKESLAKIGMELEINDLAQSATLWDIMDAEEQELWAAAWGGGIDPDMYQVYHSSSIIGAGGSESNHYHLTDAELDQLILDARLIADQDYRKSVFKQSYDIVMDWAVEVPTYNRSNVNVFSTQRVNIDTITPDLTPYWGWGDEVELLEMLNQ